MAPASSDHAAVRHGCPLCGQQIAGGELLDAAAATLRLGRLERRLLERLNRRFGAWVTTDQLIDALYWDDPSGGPLAPGKSIAVTVVHLRTKLEAIGVGIEGIPGPPGRRRLVWIGATS